jgi:hypothetical protein
LVVAALAASTAVVAVGVVVLTSGSQSSRPATRPVDVYAQLAQQLKGHLQPLVPGVLATNIGRPLKAVPRDLQVPLNGYSCAVATTNGCSLHPCTKFVQSTGVAVSASAAIAQAASTGCRNTANALPRAIPINAP